MNVVLVSSATTLGHQISDRQLRDHLTHAGMNVTTVQPKMMRISKILHFQPMVDIYEALHLSWARRRSTRTGDIVGFCSTTAALFASKGVLERSFLRFDALAASNRQGLSGWIQRRLERRALRHIPVLCPMSFTDRASWQGYRGLVIRISPDIDDGLARYTDPLMHNRSAQVVCYAGNPAKKGLEIIAAAFAKANLGPSWTLHIAGVDAKRAQNYLASHKVVPGPNVVFRGRLDRSEYLELLNRSRVFLSASRYEDFGAAQLEALSQGLVLASTVSAGPYEAGQVLQKLDVALFVDRSPGTLAEALEYAAAMDDERRDAFVAATRSHIKQFSSAQNGKIVGESLVPAMRKVAGISRLDVPKNGKEGEVR